MRGSCLVGVRGAAAPLPSEMFRDASWVRGSVLQPLAGHTKHLLKTTLRADDQAWFHQYGFVSAPLFARNFFLANTTPMPSRSRTQSLLCLLLFFASFLLLFAVCVCLCQVRACVATYNRP